MKTKYPLIILFVGIILTTLGTVFKILHLEFGPVNGNSMLTLGMLVEVIGGIWLLIKLITHPKLKDFLNS